MSSRQRFTHASPELQREIEVLQNQVRSWVGSIGKNFYILPTELQKLPIAKSYDHLLATVSEIIEAALLDPSHGESYVRLCLRLQTTVKTNDQTFSFHSLLVQQVQEYFDFLKAECLQAYEQRGNVNSPVTPLEENLVLKKNRFLAIAQLVATMYGFKIVSNSFMLACCDGLLPESDDVSLFGQVQLECLCKLLKSYIESNTKNPARMNDVGSHFERLRALWEKRVTNAKVRCAMFQAVALYDKVSVPSDRGVGFAVQKELTAKPAQGNPKVSVPVTNLATSLSEVTLSSKAYTGNRGEPVGVSGNIGQGVHNAKTWALPILPSPSATKELPAGIYDKLVDMYEMRQRNHRRLQLLGEKRLVEDCGLIRPDFGYLQWMRRYAAPTLAEQAAGISSAVDKFLKDAEGSLQQHMQAYYGTVEKATEDEINKLVESLPANGRAEVNQKAYNAALTRIQQRQELVKKL